MQEVIAATQFTPREYEVVCGILKGHTNRAIAQAMGISSYTVKGHVSRILRKMGVENRTQVAVSFSEARQAGASKAPRVRFFTGE